MIMMPVLEGRPWLSRSGRKEGSTSGLINAFALRSTRLNCYRYSEGRGVGQEAWELRSEIIKSARLFGRTIFGKSGSRIIHGAAVSHSDAQLFFVTPRHFGITSLLDENLCSFLELLFL